MAEGPCQGLATSVHEISAEERLRRVAALDLEPIVYKLMYPEPGESGLTLARADQDVALYRCFLTLCLLHPGATIVPTRQLDHVWHTHMLDTSKYRADCDWVFGFFLDHSRTSGFGEKGTGAPGGTTSLTPAACSKSTSTSISAASQQPARAVIMATARAAASAASSLRQPTPGPVQTAACSSPGVAGAADPSCLRRRPLAPVPISSKRAAAAPQSVT